MPYKMVSIFVLYLNAILIGVLSPFQCWQCFYCGEEGNGQRSQKDHVVSCHILSKRRYTRCDCGQSFRTLLDLSKHFTLKHMQTNYACENCKKVFLRESKAHSHNSEC